MLVGGVTGNDYVTNEEIASVEKTSGVTLSMNGAGEFDNLFKKITKDVVDDGKSVVEGASNPTIDIINSSDEWVKALSKEELQALNKYQTTDIYKVINNSLRNGEVDDNLIGIIEDLDSAMPKGYINDEVELYRGFTKEDIIENWDKIVERQNYTFTENGYTSTSLKPSVADNFSMLYDDEGIFAYVKVSNTNGANINAITSGVMDESEILLERGLTCEITKAWEEDGYKYVIMEVSK